MHSYGTYAVRYRASHKNWPRTQEKVLLLLNILLFSVNQHSNGFSTLFSCRIAFLYRKLLSQVIALFSIELTSGFDFMHPIDAILNGP